MKKTWISSAHQGFVRENMRSNTLSAFLLAAQKGADMIETDARATRDGILIANHDDTVRGFDEAGAPVSYVIADTDYETIARVVLAPDDPAGPQHVPTLAQVLNLAYMTGLEVNIDLKEGMKDAVRIAHMVCDYGMRGRTVYATNGAGAEAILAILAVDPDARFIDTPDNYTREALANVPGYPAKCFAYTSDFSEANIRRIRESGCMLASISLSEETAPAGLSLHPNMAEYPHTSDFEAIDARFLAGADLLKYDAKE